jgi:hypothetical protein
MTQVLKVETLEASILVATAVLLTVPLSVLAGAASDRLGRKRFFVAGLVAAAVLVVPIFKAITYFTDPQRIAVAATNPVTVVADLSGCSFQLDLVGRRRFATSCDIARAAITQAGVPYKNEAASFGAVAFVRVGHLVVNSFEGASMRPAALKSAKESFKSGLGRALAASGYVNGADRLNRPVVLLLLCCLLAPIAVFYGVGAAWLAESFPARIRYTSFSFAYHSGVALFGGTLPAIAFALVTLTGNLYSGLWYCAAAALWSALAAAFLLRETSGRAVAAVPGTWLAVQTADQLPRNL